MRLLDRYLLRQMVTPLLIGVVVFLVVLLGDEARKLGAAVTGLRVPPVLLLQYLLYAAPNALVWSLPVGVLLGVSMTATLCARAGETTAIRVGGASFPRVSAAYVAVGILASAAAFVISEQVVPLSSAQQRRVFEEMTRTQGVVHEAYDQYFRDDQGRIFYVGHMDAENNLLERVQIWTLDQTGRVAEITAAGQAVLSGEVWTLQQGATVRLNARGEPAAVEYFSSLPVQLSRALQQYYADQRTPLEMTTRELGDLATTLESTGQSGQRLRVHLAFKYSLPLACLVLALLAAPLADRFGAQGSFAGLVVAIGLVFLFNGVRSWGLALGLAGVLPPGVAGWVATVLFGGVGVAVLLGRR